jgi:uncharacterized membrane protein YfcA
VPGGLTPAELIVILGAVLIGAVVQGSVGFGFALVAAPVLTLVAPEALPVSLLLVTLPLTGVMALRERHAIDLRGFVLITAGRVVGTVGGVALLEAVPGRSLRVLFGALIALAAAISAAGPSLEAGDRTRLVAGVASGVMGTAAAVGGPALALVYRDRPGPELRSTLALSFVVGTVLSLAGLGVAGRIEGWHAVLALILLPTLWIGLLASGPLSRRVDRRWLRPAVLGYAFAAGAAALIEGLAGHA